MEGLISLILLIFQNKKGEHTIKLLINTKYTFEGINLGFLHLLIETCGHKELKTCITPLK